MILFSVLGEGNLRRGYWKGKGKVELVTVVAQHRLLALVFGYDTMF